MNTIRNPRSEGDAFLIPKNHFHAVSLSGGKDSTCMLLLMIEREMPIDMVLFADTLADPISFSSGSGLHSGRIRCGR